MSGRLPERVGDLGLAAAQQLAGVAGDALDLLGVPGQEGVVVDDLDLRLEQRVPQVGRDEIALAVVVVVALGVQHAEPVADRDARARRRGTAWRSARRVGVIDLVDRLPGDQHRHDDGLARARRHLQPDARQPVVVQLGSPARGAGGSRRCRAGPATSARKIAVSAASRWQKSTGSSRSAGRRPSAPAACGCTA